MDGESPKGAVDSSHKKGGTVLGSRGPMAKIADYYWTVVTRGAWGRQTGKTKGELLQDCSGSKEERHCYKNREKKRGRGRKEAVENEVCGVLSPALQHFGTEMDGPKRGLRGGEQTSFSWG